MRGFDLDLEPVRISRFADLDQRFLEAELAEPADVLGPYAWPRSTRAISHVLTPALTRMRLSWV